MESITPYSIAPWLSVRDGLKALDFYKTAFGATEVYRLEVPGTVVARLSVNGAEFWLSDGAPVQGDNSPETLGGGSVRMVMIVDDPDATFQRAVAAGATVVWPVDDQPYGWRVGRVVDPFGHHWEIGRML